MFWNKQNKDGTDSPLLPGITKQDLFDRWAATYDWLFPSVFYQAVHQRLLQYVSLPDTPTVLDVGCGTGRLLNRLAATFPQLHGIGLDFSTEMLRQSRRHNRHRPRLIFVKGNSRTLPFATGQFDAVFCTFSFLHYSDPSIVLAEVKRVLRSGAYFYWVDLTLSPWASCWRRPMLAAAIRLHSSSEREALGRESGLACLGHYHLLGDVLLSTFIAP